MQISVEDFFQRVAEDVFSSLMLELGAVKKKSTSTLVRYEARDWFVELLVLLEDGPRYIPRVEIGPLPQRGLVPRETQFDVIYTVPKASPLSRYTIESPYQGPDKMRAAFVHIREAIFKPYTIPMLSNHDALCDLLALRRETLEQESRVKYIEKQLKP